MKLPNGYGSITKLSGNRRNPYIVRVATGYTDEGKEIRKVLCYAKSKNEALQKLAEYHNQVCDRKNLNFELRKLTFKELYEKWILWKREHDNLSQRREARYNVAFRYYKPIENEKFIDLDYASLQAIIDSCKFGYDSKKDIKSVYTQLLEYGKLIGLPITIDYSKSLKIGTLVQSDKHKPFSELELDKLWEVAEKNIFVKLILCNIYTGTRPTEILTIKNIYIEKKYMVGGIKTKAGIDRIIPIHDSILPFIQEIFIDKKMNISYYQYNSEFKKIMAKLDMKHTPHDCRHTCTTLLDNANANEICKKMILGHAIKGVTDKVYTHKTITQLIETINLI